MAFLQPGTKSNCNYFKRSHIYFCKRSHIARAHTQFAFIKELTRSVVSGASAPPIRPVIEHKFKIVVLKLVGHSSAVKMYSTLNANVIDDLPIIDSKSMYPYCSVDTNGAQIAAIPDIINEVKSNFFRPNRFSNTIGNNAPAEKWWKIILNYFRF